jgi:hypothetical protein
VEDQIIEPITEQPAPVESQDAPKPEAEKPPEKPALTPEQERIRKLENANARQRQSLADARAKLAHAQQQALTREQTQAYNRPQAGDGETLSIPSAHLERIVAEKAKELAPQFAQKDAEESSRRTAAESMVEKIGHERFAELTADLAEILPGELQLHLLDTKAPAALLEYLADPDHESEARAIARMNPFKAGAAMTELAIRLSAVKAPQPSSAAPALEPVKGRGGSVEKDPSTMTDKQFAEWRRSQIAQRR